MNEEVFHERKKISEENESCFRCDRPVVMGLNAHVISIPVYSPTGYPEDTSSEDAVFCTGCYRSIADGLDQTGVEP